ncbi:hypothetical protein FQR65_LT03467 [Abscondita terminalis]|nr:hypothetical protein FQR65_LT03467 [Abscondita terminalis]
MSLLRIRRLSKVSKSSFNIRADSAAGSDNKNVKDDSVVSDKVKPNEDEKTKVRQDDTYDESSSDEDDEELCVIVV